MKMAKASGDDMEMALHLSNALEGIFGRWSATMPPKPGADQEADQEPEDFDEDDPEQCVEVLQRLKDIYQRGSLFRVIFGMAVLLDLRNKVVDPNSDVLEIHPAIRSEQCDGIRFRFLTAEHAESSIEQRRRELVKRMPLLGFNALVSEIDALMAESGAVQKTPEPITV